MGKGIVIPYQDTIVRPQGPTDLVVDVHFFSVMEARIHKATSSDEEQIKAAISSSALRLDVTWCSRNSVTLRVILMLANTVKNAGAPKRCLLHVTREFHSIKLICRNLYAIFFTCEKSLYSQSEWRTAVFHM